MSTLFFPPRASVSLRFIEHLGCDWHSDEHRGISDGPCGLKRNTSLAIAAPRQLRSSIVQLDSLLEE